MKPESRKTSLKREFRLLFRSLNFVAEHPALKKEAGREAERLAEVYQQFGLAWEFLGLQCRHWDGWRKTKEGKNVCRICGTIKDAHEGWVLLPSGRTKVVGQKMTPNSKKTFANKKAAVLLDDTIVFHGAKLRVEVQNMYRSKQFRRSDIAIAADRMVTLEEGGVECGFDTHMIRLRMERRQRGAEPPFGAFPSELSRKELKRFPVMFEYDRQRRFVGLCVFKPRQQRNIHAATPPKRRRRR